MPNNLFNSTQNNNIINEFNRFQKNPMQFLIDRKINIPKECMNDPREAVQYLLNSGQMSQESFNQLVHKANSLGLKM